MIRERAKMEQYSILGRIGEGAHGIVLKAKHIEVGTLNLIIAIIIVWHSLLHCCMESHELLWQRLMKSFPEIL